MLKSGFLLCLFMLLNTSDCDPQKGQDERMRSLEADVKQLKAEVSELKQRQATPQHHYELRNVGFRTFRFDPGTGETCIQLTTPGDWKSKETEAQSCDCTDRFQHYMEMPQANVIILRQFLLIIDFFVKPACGD